MILHFLFPARCGEWLSGRRGGYKSWTLPWQWLFPDMFPPPRYCRSPRLDSDSNKTSLTRVQTMLKYCTHTVPWLHRNTENHPLIQRWGCKYTENLCRIHFYSTIHLQTTSIVPLLFGLTHTYTHRGLFRVRIHIQYSYYTKCSSCICAAASLTSGWNYSWPEFTLCSNSSSTSINSHISDPPTKLSTVHLDFVQIKKKKKKKCTSMFFFCFVFLNLSCLFFWRFSLKTEEVRWFVDIQLNLTDPYLRRPRSSSSSLLHLHDHS